MADKEVKGFKKHGRVSLIGARYFSIYCIIILILACVS